METRVAGRRPCTVDRRLALAVRTGGAAIALGHAAQPGDEDRVCAAAAQKPEMGTGCGTPHGVWRERLLK